MIECPSCKTSFSPKFRQCPRCGVYEAKLEDRMEYLAQIVEEDLDRWANLSQAEAILIAEGVSPATAQEIVAAKAKKVARTERWYAAQRIFVGTGLILLSTVCVFLAVVTVWPRLYILAVFLGLTGAWPLILGIRSLFSGRDAYHPGDHNR